MSMIDKDKIISDLQKVLGITDGQIEKGGINAGIIDSVNPIIGGFLQYILNLPTIDAVEVKHGEWIEVHDWLQIPQEESGTYRCSACGQVMKYPWNYCPNCGAKMDGERRDPCS